MEIALHGPSGEPVDLWRTLVSHGVASLPPSELDEDARVLTVTVPVRGAKPRTLDAIAALLPPPGSRGVVRPFRR